MNSCKRNLCVEYKAPKNYGHSHYTPGVKRCSICAIFLKWEGNRCPCCEHRLRKGPKAKKYRDRMEKSRIG